LPSFVDVKLPRGSLTVLAVLEFFDLIVDRLPKYELIESIVLLGEEIFEILLNSSDACRMRLDESEAGHDVRPFLEMFL